MINLLGVAGSARHILHILIYHEHNCHLTINIVTLPITSIETISTLYHAGHLVGQVILHL